MTPADELRTAADTLRQARFTGAMTATPAVAALIRAREPLARWLTKLADFCDEVERTHGQQPPDDNPSITDALAVARQINGGPR
jgi:hypothetical protein